MKKKTIERFLEAVTSRMSGEWVLIGGSLLHALKISDRVTLDIDFVPVTPVTNRETLLLMETAIALELPPESINMAGELYLKKIKNWKNELIRLKSSKTCTVYRPNATLFILLKLARLSETDFDDILKMIDYAHFINENIDVESLQKSIHAFLKKPLPTSKIRRYKNLARAIRS